MHNHWDSNLTLRDIILERKPSLIVECGAGSGENTRQLLSLQSIYPFKLVTISDGKFDPSWIEAIWGVSYNPETFEWREDISYRGLTKFDDASIGLCIIDTDHNYWTMREELKAVHPKLKSDGLIAMHDTETYWKNSGQANRYGTGDPYPGDEISKHEKEGKSMGAAIEEFLSEHPEYKVLKKVSESHGAMVLEKSDA